MEKKRASAEVSDSVRDKVTDVIDEELDPTPPVNSSGRIRRKPVRALEDEIYKEGPIEKNKKNATCT